MIHKDMSMGKALLDYNRLLPLLSRFHMELGFGESTVEEVCRQHRINTDFFLEIANAYLDKDMKSPEVDLSLFPLSDMVAYLQATHSYYVDVALPRMERQMGRLLEDPALSEKEIKLLRDFFKDYKEDFMVHISLEEKEILPYILELEKQALKEESDPSFEKRLEAFSISDFAKEHDRLELCLEDLSKLIIKYLPPLNRQELCIRILRDLSDLVRDLVDHADMEDRVLIPRVERLEQQVRKQLGLA